MGILVSKFLNTVTHFSRSTLGWKGLSALVIAFAQTRFISPLSADLDSVETATQQSVTGENITVVQTIIEVDSNTLDGSTTIRIRDDGADVGDVITIGAGISGKIINTLVTPPTILSSSLINWSAVTLGTVGQINIRSMRMVYQRVIN